MSAYGGMSIPGSSGSSCGTAWCVGCARAADMSCSIRAGARARSIPLGTERRQLSGTSLGYVPISACCESMQDDSVFALFGWRLTSYHPAMAKPQSQGACDQRSTMVVHLRSSNCMLAASHTVLQEPCACRETAVLLPPAAAPAGQLTRRRAW
jgi:hypothetical protein